MLRGTRTFAFAGPRAVGRVHVVRGISITAPGGKDPYICWKTLFVYIYDPEGEDSVPFLSPLFMPFNVCGCYSRAPFALLANFVRTGVVCALIAVIYIYIYLIPFIILALLSRSLPVVFQIRDHIAGPSLSSPLRYVRSF